MIAEESRPAGSKKATRAPEAVARMAAAEAAASDETLPSPADPDVPLRNVLKRPRLDTLGTLDTSREEDVHAAIRAPKAAASLDAETKRWGVAFRYIIVRFALACLKRSSFR